MSRIVAIGGGEIGRPGYPVETTEIDTEIIKLSGKARPRLLFVPTATDDADTYVEAVDNHFGKRLGCDIEVLYLVAQKPELDDMRAKVFGADIVYVGGGDTSKMLRTWRRFGVDRVLREAPRRNVVLSGLSAGSICWFRYGSSARPTLGNPSGPSPRIRGLNLINALHAPHYDVNEFERPYLREMMKTTPGVALAVDNCCALVFVDDTYRVISSRSTAKAYRVYWKKGEFQEEIIEQKDEFSPLDQLLSK